MSLTIGPGVNPQPGTQLCLKNNNREKALDKLSSGCRIRGESPAERAVINHLSARVNTLA